MDIRVTEEKGKYTVSGGHGSYRLKEVFQDLITKFKESIQSQNLHNVFPVTFEHSQPTFVQGIKFPLPII